MEYGVHLPQILFHTDRDSLSGFARVAESLGYDSLWVSDHIVVPREIASRYPYQQGGDFPVGPQTPWLDPISVLTFVAAITSRPRLGTSVLIVPYRNPVVAAKLLASLDALSDGRLILGAGVGWMAEEFAALGVPFAQRGARTDEYLRLMQQLWRTDDTAYRGRFYQLDNVGFYPKPTRQPPIWIGGDTEAAFRRAATIGDGYHAFHYLPEKLRVAWQRVRVHAERAGRDPASLTLSVRIALRRGDAALPELIEQYRDLGVAHIVFDVGIRSMASAEETLRWFAGDVRPQLET